MKGGGGNGLMIFSACRHTRTHLCACIAEKGAGRCTTTTPPTAHTHTHTHTHNRTCSFLLNSTSDCRPAWGKRRRGVGRARRDSGRGGVPGRVSRVCGYVCVWVGVRVCLSVIHVPVGVMILSLPASVAGPWVGQAKADTSRRHSDAIDFRYSVDTPKEDGEERYNSSSSVNMRVVCARSFGCAAANVFVTTTLLNVSRPPVAPSRGEQHKSLALINISPPVFRMWSLTPPQMNAPSMALSSHFAWMVLGGRNHTFSFDTEPHVAAESQMCHGKWKTSTRKRMWKWAVEPDGMAMALPTSLNGSVIPEPERTTRPCDVPLECSV